MKLQNDRLHVPTIGDFQLNVENLVDHFLGDRPAHAAVGVTLPVSISESETAYRLIFELPGVEPSEVNVEAVDSVLHVSGEKKIPEVAEGETVLQNNRRKGQFRRSFEFAKSIDTDRIEAEFQHGLLTISVPKSEKVLPKKIEIKSAV